MMRRAFGDVLDATLGASAGVSSHVLAGGIHTAGLHAAPFGPWRHGMTAFRRVARSAEVADESTTPAASLLRPHTDVERAAWRTLQRYGAGLPDAFSAFHLKRAFRRLAQQLHPDRHPGLGATARAELCRDFATARAAYDTLLAIR